MDYDIKDFSDTEGNIYGKIIFPYFAFLSHNFRLATTFYIVNFV